MKKVLFTLLAAIVLATPAIGEAEVKWKPGHGFKAQTRDGDNSLHVGGRLQARYTFHEFDNDRDEETTSSFTVERVRLFARGHMFADWKYNFEAEFGSSTSDSHSTTLTENRVTLMDAVITYARLESIQFSMGQFRTHFGEQGYIYEDKQMFVDRSLATSEFALDRDIGISLHGAGWDGRFEYNIGAFNSEGANASQFQDGHLFVGRVAFQPNGPYGEAEADLDRTDDHLWLISLAGAMSKDSLSPVGVGASGKTMTCFDDCSWDTDIYNLAFGYKHRGINFQGEYFWRNEEYEGLDSSTATDRSRLADIDSEGFYAQLGYVFGGSQWGIAGRYAEVDPDTDTREDKESDIQFGVSRYFMDVGHSLKIDADVSWNTVELNHPEFSSGSSDDLDDFEFRLQMTLLY